MSLGSLGCNCCPIDNLAGPLLETGEQQNFGRWYKETSQSWREHSTF